MFTLDQVVPWGRSFDEYRRIFPVLALGGERSPFVDGSIRARREAGLDVTVERVPYEFQRGGKEMLRIRRSAALTPT